MSVERRLFVGREKEIEHVLDPSFDWRCTDFRLGSCNRKTALIEKVTERIIDKEPKSTLIQIKSTPDSYPGWLSDRLTQKLYQQIETDKKLSLKIADWFIKHGPALWEIIKSVLVGYPKFNR